jgi:predicted PurR-regulated permease PerM
VEVSDMTRLMMILLSIVSTTLMGIGIVIALTIGQDTLQPILIAAAIGFVLSIPVSWYIARQLS